eukprot:Nk52_evm10s236 gene=Nk52_evmTU10s236
MNRLCVRGGCKMGWEGLGRVLSEVSTGAAISGKKRHRRTGMGLGWVWSRGLCSEYKPENLTGLYARGRVSDSERLEMFDKANSINYLIRYDTPPWTPVLTARSIGYVVESDIIFENINFSLKPGGALLLQGPNGCGKSTLMNMILGQVKPTVGAFTLNNIKIERPKRSPLRHTGFCQYLYAELLGMHPEFTVEENMGYYDAHMFASSDPSLALDALDVLHLRGRLFKFCSMGQKKRCNLARMLHVAAPLWIMDEPTVGLDIPSIRILELMITHHRNRGGMVIVSSHQNLKLENATTLKFPGTFTHKFIQ